MIDILDTRVYGWQAAIRGARNPLDSWRKSDSFYSLENLDFIVGDADKKLMKTLASAGTDHGKFLRMIIVTCDINAPLYWWKQFDTYRAGVEKNSRSTMHKIHAYEFFTDNFSTEHLDDEDLEVLKKTVERLNVHRERYMQTNDKEEWYRMVQMLPDSYNQLRTVQMSYAAIKNMYHARKDHKLAEWQEFCEWAETLPLFCEICV